MIYIKPFIILLMLIPLIYANEIQPDQQPQNKYIGNHNAILLGFSPGQAIGLNYENIGQAHSLKIGLMYLPKASTPYLGLPFNLNHFWGEQHRLEIGGGVLLSPDALLLTGNIGYLYIANIGLYFRMEFMPFIPILPPFSSDKVPPLDEIPILIFGIGYIF